MALQHSPSIVTNGLVFCLDAGNPRSYPGTGTNWGDISGGKNATLINGPTYTSGLSGYMSFDGVDDYANVIPASATYDITNQFTIEFVCNPTNLQNTGFFNLDGPAQDRGIMCHWPWGDGNIYYDIYNTAGGFFRWYKTVSIVNTVALYQVILDGSGNMIVKQNNIVMAPTGTSTFTGTVSLGSSFTIGSFGPGASPWQGNLYYFKIYNRALTDAETTQNFNALRGRYGI